MVFFLNSHIANKNRCAAALVCLQRRAEKREIKERKLRAPKTKRHDARMVNDDNDDDDDNDSGEDGEDAK